MKFKYFFFILFVLILPCAGIAAKDFKTVERTTLRLYEEKKWDSLIIVGKQALKEEIDYYFLRMRLGIAYYSTTRYISASGHFRKATEFNSSDPVAWEYLYSSYVLSNRNNDALAIIRKMPSPLQEKYIKEKKTVELISAEGGATFSSDQNKVNTLDIKSKASPYGEQDVYGNSYYIHAGGLFNLSKTVNLKVAYNYLNFSKIKFFQYLQFDNTLDSVVNYWYGFSNYYNFSPTEYSSNYPYTVHQHELHLESSISPGNGFRLEPAFHLLKVNYNNITLSYSKTSITDTIFYDSITPQLITYPVEKELYTLNHKDTGFYNYLFSLGIAKTFSLFDIRISGSYSNLNNKNQFQLGGSFSWYPLGNLNLYSTTGIAGLFQKKDKRLILGQTLGGRIFKTIWLEGNFIYGDLTNGNLANGSIVYNNSDKINYRIGANLIWLATKNLEVSLIYQYFEKENVSYYYLFDNKPPNTHTKTETQYQKYHTNSIIFGIKWKL